MNSTFSGTFKLRAVVIFEHQNLNFSSDTILPHVKDVVIIQVGQLLKLALVPADEFL